MLSNYNEVMQVYLIYLKNNNSKALKKGVTSKKTRVKKDVKSRLSLKCVRGYCCIVDVFLSCFSVNIKTVVMSQLLYSAGRRHEVMGLCK